MRKDTAVCPARQPEPGRHYLKHGSYSRAPHAAPHGGHCFLALLLFTAWPPLDDAWVPFDAWDFVLPCFREFELEVTSIAGAPSSSSTKSSRSNPPIEESDCTVLFESLDGGAFVAFSVAAFSVDAFSVAAFPEPLLLDVDFLDSSVTCCNPSSGTGSSVTCCNLSFFAASSFGVLADGLVTRDSSMHMASKSRRSSSTVSAFGTGAFFLGLVEPALALFPSCGFFEAALEPPDPMPLLEPLLWVFFAGPLDAAAAFVSAAVIEAVTPAPTSWPGVVAAPRNLAKSVTSRCFSIVSSNSV
mmetsp:Transcript_60523/g.174607  ORF Transcript_60523/g.174607 Transcript_60523/m.174607 type:complete len:300 (-) Transcript_60523:250-1149(-)